MKMNKSFLAKLMTTAIAVSGVLGFSSCNNDNTAENTAGTPSAKVDSTQIYKTRWQQAETRAQMAEQHSAVMTDSVNNEHGRLVSMSAKLHACDNNYVDPYAVAVETPVFQSGPAPLKTATKQNKKNTSRKTKATPVAAGAPNNATILNCPPQCPDVILPEQATVCFWGTNLPVYVKTDHNNRDTARGQYRTHVENTDNTMTKAVEKTGQEINRVDQQHSYDLLFFTSGNRANTMMQDHLAKYAAYMKQNNIHMPKCEEFKTMKEHNIAMLALVSKLEIDIGPAPLIAANQLNGLDKKASKEMMMPSSFYNKLMDQAAEVEKQKGPQKGFAKYGIAQAGTWEYLNLAGQSNMKNKKAHSRTVKANTTSVLNGFFATEFGNGAAPTDSTAKPNTLQSGDAVKGTKAAGDTTGTVKVRSVKGVDKAVVAGVVETRKANRVADRGKRAAETRAQNRAAKQEQANVVATPTTTLSPTQTVTVTMPATTKAPMSPTAVARNTVETLNAKGSTNLTETERKQRTEAIKVSESGGAYKGAAPVQAAPAAEAPKQDIKLSGEAIKVVYQTNKNSIGLGARSGLTTPVTLSSEAAAITAAVTKGSISNTGGFTAMNYSLSK